MRMEEKLVQKQFSISTALFTLSVVTCVIWILRTYWKNRRFYKLAARIPSYGLSKGFDFGLQYFGKSINESFLQTLEYFKVSPEVWKIWLGHKLVVCVSKPEHMELLLNNVHSMNKSSLVDFTKSYMGDGLFNAPMNIWKKHRKLINPSFNQKILNSFNPIFAEKCDILIGVLETAVGQPNVDIMKILSNCTLDTICETAMGLKVEAQTTSNRFGGLLDRFLEIVTTRIFNILYHSDTIFYMNKIGKELTEITTELNGFSQRVIQRRRESFEQRMRGDYIEGDTNKIKTFLERLMDISYNGDQFSDQEIRDEVNTFIAAGSDTTAVALCFCCLTLGLHPEYQQKVYEEAIDVLGEDRYPTANDLPKLKFVDMFIKETLRIFPVAPLLARITTDDVQIDEFLIPEGTILIMGILHLHRNQKYWKDPLKFNPYRFLPEEWSKKHPYSHLPFSGGPRGCIGSRYAMMMMKLILSKLVRKFRITTDYKSIEEVNLKINLMSRPSQGFKLHLELRE